MDDLLVFLVPIAVVTFMTVVLGIHP